MAFIKKGAKLICAFLVFLPVPMLNNVKRQTGNVNFKLQTSNFKPQTSNFKL